MNKLTNEIVIQKAKALGFDLVGFAKAEELKEEVLRLEEWLDKGYNAKMAYMQRNLDKRLQVSEILPEAKSVISLALNYNTDEKYSNNEGTAKISRYAFGKDYHIILWNKLDKLIEELKSIDPDFLAKSYVDTGPVMDKAWAVRSGLGWMGKHSNVISKQFGSWVFLSTVITNYEFRYNSPIEDFCGTCRRCIDACPTDAIVADKVIDANRCISFLTIENKEEIPDEFTGRLDNWIFGCDVCQDVCPWNNKFSLVTGETGFFPVNNSNKEIGIEEVLKMDNIEFKQRFKDSPVSRTKLKGLKRNASFLKSDNKDS